MHQNSTSYLYQRAVGKLSSPKINVPASIVKACVVVASVTCHIEKPTTKENTKIAIRW